MDKGYKLYEKFFPIGLLDNVSRDFESVATFFPDSDVFRTKDGDVKQIQNCQFLPEFKDIAKHIHLMGFNGEILNMQYFIKHPGYKITAPHQDGAYFDNIDDDIITFWIPLHRVGLDDGVLCYVDWDGSRVIRPHNSLGSNIRVRTGKVGYSQYNDEFDLSEFKPMEVGYGDCLIHNQFAMHYSDMNRGDKPRIAITCILRLI
jgi:ectoine hydroxylase-related dioxygenase (phytanoyl-CoA dioxygenase family)